METSLCLEFKYIGKLNSFFMYLPSAGTRDRVNTQRSSNSYLNTLNNLIIKVTNAICEKYIMLKFYIMLKLHCVKSNINEKASYIF